MIRVVLMITELRPAGAERVVFELATRLDRRRFEPHVLALWSMGGVDGPFAKTLRDAGVPVHMLRVGSKLDLLRVPPLVGILRKIDPAILHSHLFHANLVARLVAPLVRGPKVIATHHVVERRRLGVRKVLDRLTAGRDDETVAVSEAVAGFARSACGAQDVRVIPNGVDLAPFRAAELPPDLAPRKLVGALGRLDPQKGHADLIRAWPLVLAKHPDASLAIGGEGLLRPDLERLIVRHGVERSVTLHGHRSDVPRFLSALSVFCMPSRWEGFGLALVEAMACGKPCVASSVDSLPEVLGDAGMLVPVGDPVMLARAVTALLDDPSLASSLGSRARARAERFSVEKMIEAYEALYEEVAWHGSRNR
jgi:starch synthase (maltosyl-transferring)